MLDQKQIKKQHVVVKNICNRLQMQYSFGNIKTWNDIYKWTGYDPKLISTFTNGSIPVTIHDVKAWQKKLEDDLEKSISEKIKEASTPKEAPLSAVQLAISTPQSTRQSNIDKIAIQQTELMKSEKSPVTDTETTASDLPKSPLEKAFLFYFQRNAVIEALKKLTVEKKPAILVIGGTGVGKTFVLGAILRRLMDAKWEDGKSFAVTPYIYVTKSTIVEKTKRDLKHFSINHPEGLEVINVEALRSRVGTQWVKDELQIVNGEEQRVFTWHKMLNPAVVAWDECQGLKNDSTQRAIAIAYNHLENTTQIFLSATPFGKVSEAKAFCLATKMDISHLGFPQGTILSETTWPTFSALIASPADPNDYVEAAMERLEDIMKDYIVRIKNVRWQFNPVNSVEIIDFSTPEEREEYERAWERYLIKKAKLEQEVTDNPRFRALVELGQFLAAAEYCKREIFARRMYNDVQEGYAAYLAVKFKRTLIAVVKILVEKYGVSRDQISLIWGGGQTQLTDKQKMKQKIKENAEMFEAAGITLEDLALQDVEDRTIEELPENLRLGSQSLKERQHEIDRYQSGKSLYCIYTYKAGGVGLSLHHSDEYVKQKVRRKPDSGYAVEEDIQLIPVRPRKGTIGPTWSAIDLAQGSGRGARLTSLSDTLQTFLYYKGTVEANQAAVVMHKLRCVGKAVKQRENWTILIEKYQEANRLEKEIIEATKKDESEQVEEVEVEQEGE